MLAGFAQMRIFAITYQTDLGANARQFEQDQNWKAAMLPRLVTKGKMICRKYLIEWTSPDRMLAEGNIDSVGLLTSGLVTKFHKMAYGVEARQKGSILAPRLSKIRH
jgi:hypothetical protein